MTKVRVFMFISTLIVVGIIGVFATFYARGYKLNFKALFTQGVVQFEPNGIFVVKSEPDGASVYLNNELKTATNATISLSPGTYDVQVKKDGFFTWYKRITIDKEVVTSATVSLFKNVPALSPITFGGVVNPISSDDQTKMAFVVPFSKENTPDKAGLWTMDTFSLPLGFTSGPKRITDGDLGSAVYEFSPDAKQILLTTSNGVFLLDSGSFTAQANRVNISSRKEEILAEWEKERELRNLSLIKPLPPQLSDILSRRSSDINFSPDTNMVLFTASASGTLPENLIAPLPGSSTQRQERQIQAGYTYLYDIKEDRNFLISDQAIAITNKPLSLAPPAGGEAVKSPALRWMPNSRHLLLALPSEVIIMDYDGTNRQVVYSGAYAFPYAFPYINSTKLLVLTNLGALTSSLNLYTLTVK